MRFVLFAILMLMATAVYAQQQPQPTIQDLQDIIAAMESQKNQLSTSLVLEQAKVLKLQRENAAMKAELDELKKKGTPDAK